MLEMSNSHTSANCVVVTSFNGIPFPLTKLLDYTNPFFLENGTVAKKGYRFLAKRLLFLAVTVGV